MRLRKRKEPAAPAPTVETEDSGKASAEPSVAPGVADLSQPHADEVVESTATADTVMVQPTPESHPHLFDFAGNRL